jgi:hypothetical protein
MSSMPNLILNFWGIVVAEYTRLGRLNLYDVIAGKKIFCLLLDGVHEVFCYHCTLFWG